MKHLKDYRTKLREIIIYLRKPTEDTFTATSFAESLVQPGEYVGYCNYNSGFKLQMFDRPTQAKVSDRVKAAARAKVKALAIAIAKDKAQAKETAIAKTKAKDNTAKE